jgi:hypothetical protein
MQVATRTRRPLLAAPALLCAAAGGLALSRMDSRAGWAVALLALLALVTGVQGIRTD